MSTDYQVWCTNCKESRHLGQAMGGGYSFGFGPNDTAAQSKIMKFIADHVSHEVLDNTGYIVDTDMTPYLRIGYDEPEGQGYVWLDGVEEEERNHATD
jgi:hypothetical protein